MHAGTATRMPASTIASGGRPVLAPLIVVITVKATIAPIITTSPWAKLMSWMIP
jgi:hypothetical protein